MAGGCRARATPDFWELASHHPARPTREEGSDDNEMHTLLQTLVELQKKQ